MTARRKLWLWTALAAWPLSLGAGWCWNRSCDVEYIASARVSVPWTAFERDPVSLPAPNVEERLLAPEVVAAASDLLRERGVSLPLASPFDSEIDHLLNRLAAAPEREGDRVEIELRYRTPDAAQAVPVLTAVVDAGVQALQSLVPQVVDSVLEARLRERERLAQSLEQQKSLIGEWEGRIAARNREPSDSVANAESLRSLEAELDDARARRIESEDHLARACQEVRAGVAIDEIAARLPQGSTWSATRDLAGTLRLKDEHRQLEAAFEAAAAVYGRNHPRMVGLRTQVDRIRQQLNLRTEPASISFAEQDSTSAETEAITQPSSPTTGVLLLKALEEKCRQATAAEQDLEAKLTAAMAGHNERQGLEAQLARARQELAFLQTEHERVRREIVAARREGERRLVNVAEPPALSPAPIVPSLLKHLLWGGAGGMLVSGGLLRGFFRCARGPSYSSANSSETNGRERLRSREEDILARLRRLKPVA